MPHKTFLAIILAMSVSIPLTAAADDDYDDDDYRPRQSQKHQTKRSSKSTKTIISRQKAGEIARRQIKGARVLSIDYDDDGVAVYEVDVVSGRAKYDVKINAHTGRVIRVKRD